MIWAKIVNNEIMQTHDENPAGLWHPDAIAKNDIPGYWEEIPDHVNVGWKFKNDEWISGGQWMEELAAENLPLLPGPPTCCINYAPSDDPMSETFIINVDSCVSGVYDSWSITISDTVYSTTVTATNSTTNEFTCGTTEWLAVGDQVTFMGSLGGVEKHKMYVVKSVTDSKKFKICDPATPVDIVELTTENGTMMLSKGPNFKETFQKTTTPQALELSITATGPTGPTTYIAEGPDLELIIPEKWVPLFARP